MLARDQAVPRKPISPEVSMITSLLNLRNTLKKNYTDDKVLETLLSFNFIETLMNEHMEALEGKEV